MLILTLATLVVLYYLLVLGTAPVASTRIAPVGIKLDDGYRTLVTIAADTDISFWEKSLKPPGLDGGDPVPTSTMWNNTYNTFNPRQLKTMTESTVMAAYDPAVFSQLLAVINVKTTITFRYPDGTTLAYYGYVRSAEPSEIVEGAQPQLTITIQPTNQDPTTGAEEAAVLVSVAGT